MHSCLLPHQFLYVLICVSVVRAGWEPPRLPGRESAKPSSDVQGKLPSLSFTCTLLIAIIVFKAGERVELRLEINSSVFSCPLSLALAPEELGVCPEVLRPRCARWPPGYRRPSLLLRREIPALRDTFLDTHVSFAPSSPLSSGTNQQLSQRGKTVKTKPCSVQHLLVPPVLPPHQNPYGKQEILQDGLLADAAIVTGF